MAQIHSHHAETKQRDNNCTQEGTAPSKPHGSPCLCSAAHRSAAHRTTVLHNGLRRDPPASCIAFTTLARDAAYMLIGTWWVLKPMLKQTPGGAPFVRWRFGEGSSILGAARDVITECLAPHQPARCPQPHTQAARGWAHPPCKHFKIQSCFRLELSVGFPNPNPPELLLDPPPPAVLWAPPAVLWAQRAAQPLPASRCAASAPWGRVG